MKFLLKKERVFFFRGFLPSKYSGSVAGRNAVLAGKNGGGWGEGHFLLARPNSNELAEIQKNDKIVVMNTS